MAAHSHSSSDHSNFYVDPWQEYKVITGKLKKRFLRKPNIGEAARELQTLAVRCAEEETPQYAAMCKLAAARCEHQLSNVTQECANLKEAARLFIDCELETKNYNSPSFNKNLNTAIHCYGHAIKSLAENKFFQQAGHVCLELGQNLLKLDRPYESVEYFDKALKFYKNQPMDELQALKMSFIARILNNEPRNALNVLEKSKNLLELRYCVKQGENGMQKLGPMPKMILNGFLRKFLRDVEVLRILLICAIAPDVPQRLTPDELALRRTFYGKEGTLDSETLSNHGVEFDGKNCTNLGENEFLLLQSFVLALHYKDFDSADLCLTDLRPYLDEIQLDLALDVFDQLKEYSTTVL